MTSSYQPGWYPVANSTCERYHDGTTWTDHYRDDQQRPVAPPQHEAATETTSPPPPEQLPPPSLTTPDGAARDLWRQRVLAADSWLEQARRNNINPSQAYQGLVGEGKARNDARRLAEQLVPGSQQHPVISYVFYFAVGFAALAGAGALHALVDLFAVSTPPTGGVIDRVAVSAAPARSGNQTLFALWVTMFVIAGPLAIITGVRLWRIDATEKYARLATYRRQLNNTLIGIAAGVAILRLLAYVYFLVNNLLSDNAGLGTSATTDIVHTIVTVTIASMVLLFAYRQHQLAASVWNEPTARVPGATTPVTTGQ